MLRRLLATALLVCSLSGCRQPQERLEANATAALQNTVFNTTTSLQTLRFTTGNAQAAKPYALDGFLYAKHWLECKTTEPGPFAPQSVCTFDVAGRTYAHENGWTVASASTCATCETWSVPLARAELQHITGIVASDKTHATVTYAYHVVPNVFGSELAVWMGQHPTAWCGPDPRALGDWSRSRTGTATLNDGGGSQPAATPPDFATTFGTATRTAQPCPGETL